MASYGDLWPLVESCGELWRDFPLWGWKSSDTLQEAEGVQLGAEQRTSALSNCLVW